MKGICFKEYLFLATIAGKKTQTRRNINVPNGFIGKPVGEPNNPDNPLGFMYIGGILRPKYNIGNKIYLKEPYCLYEEKYQELKTSPTIEIAYKYGVRDAVEAFDIYPYEIITGESVWKNKLFMPESVARYFIEITGVRCERLQDITEEDCIKEGIIENKEAKPIGYPFGIKFPFNNGIEKANYSTAKEAYAALYDKINGKGTWEKNEYVWVYDYKLVK